MATRKLEVVITGDSSQLEKTLGSLSGKASGFGATMKKAALPAAAALGGIAIGAKKAIDAASGLAESQNAVRVVFGESAAQIEAFSKKAAKEAGLSMRDLNELVTPLGAAFRNMGDSTDEAAQKSITLAKRAADMASVFNVDVKEALGAIQAGLRGEADPLERFGVGLSDAAVTAKALKMGLADTAKELNAGEKAQARYALLMEQTNRVAGDFANTSGGLANQQRIASAQFENLSASIGQKLLPVMVKLMSVVLDVINFVSRNWPKIAAVVGPVMDDIRKSVGEALEDVQRFWDQHGERIVKIVTSVFGTVRQAVENTMDIIKGIVDVAMGILTGDWQRAWDGIKSIVDGALDNILLALGTILPLMGKAALAIGTGIKNKVVEGLQGIGSAAWGVIDNIGQWIIDKASAIAGWGTGIGSKVKQAVVDALVGIGLAAWNVVDNIGSKIGEMASTIIGWGTSIGSKILNAVPEALKGIGGIAWNIINEIGSKIEAMTDTIKGWGSSIIGKIINGLRGAASDLWDAVEGIFDKLPGIVKNILGIGSPSKVFADIGKDIVSGLVKGLENKAGDLRNAATDMAKQIAGDAWDKLSGVAKGAGSAIAGAAGAVGGALGFGGGEGVEGAGGKAGYVYGDIVGLASSLLTALRDMSGASGRSIYVQSGFRSFAEQAALVAKLGLWSPSNPTGAAAPGTSKHESGRAADITPGRELFGWLASRFGLTFPIPQEPWHVEKYDQGGILKPGLTLAYNGTRMNEYVSRARGGGTVINVTLPNYLGNERDVARALRDELRALDRIDNGGRTFNSRPALT